MNKRVYNVILLNSLDHKFHKIVEELSSTSDAEKNARRMCNEAFDMIRAARREEFTFYMHEVLDLEFINDSVMTTTAHQEALRKEAEDFINKEVLPLVEMKYGVTLDFEFVDYLRPEFANALFSIIVQYSINDIHCINMKESVNFFWKQAMANNRSETKLSSSLSHEYRGDDNTIFNDPTVVA